MRNILFCIRREFKLHYKRKDKKSKKNNNIQPLIVFIRVGSVPPFIGFFPKAIVTLILVKINL